MTKFDEALTFEPTEAFDWLLQQFRDYSHGKIIWTDVRNVFATATALQDKFHVEPEHLPVEPPQDTEQKTCDAET